MVTRRDTCRMVKISERSKGQKRIFFTQARHVVVENCKQKSLPPQLGEHGANDANGRCDCENGETEPVEFFPPI